MKALFTAPTLSTLTLRGTAGPDELALFCMVEPLYRVVQPHIADDPIDARFWEITAMARSPFNEAMVSQHLCRWFPEYEVSYIESKENRKIFLIVLTDFVPPPLPTIFAPF